MSARPLIVLHADDLGMNVSVNAGIMSGFSHGLLTSTSILSNGPGFTDAVHRWKALEQERAAGRLCSADRRRLLGELVESPFDLGVHLNLTEGTPVTPGFPSECLDSSGRFSGIGPILRRSTMASARLRSAIMQELAAQIGRVVDAGLRPTHLNGHHYVELLPALTEPMRALTVRFQIPAVRVARERRIWLALRNHPSPVTNLCLTVVKAGLAMRLRHRVQDQLYFAGEFCGSAHAGRMSIDLLRRSVGHLRPGRTLEVGLHPGVAAPAPTRQDAAQGWSDPLADLRPAELAMLQSPELFDVLAGAALQLGRIARVPGRASMAS